MAAIIYTQVIQKQKKEENDRYSPTSDSDSDIDLSEVVEIQEKSNETLNG